MKCGKIIFSKTLTCLTMIVKSAVQEINFKQPFKTMSNIKLPFVICILVSFQFVGTTAAQNVSPSLTVVEGYVLDALKGDTIPFANIGVVGTSIGKTADENGYFKFAYTEAKNELQISAVGFKTIFKTIKIGESQTFNILLNDATTELQTVVIQKQRYRNRNNPAVELITNVIAHKSQNRLENHDFYQYKQYEKLELDLANVGEDFKNSKYLTNVKFFFADVDTTKAKGKALIPTYLREKSSNIYYRKNPSSHKEYVEGLKTANLGTLFDDEGVAEYLHHLYVKADIYDNEILLFKKPFLSPLSPLSPTFYRFYIMDTVVVNGKKCINLAFFPRSKADLTFEGHLYIADDSTYAICKVDMTVPKYININFLNQLQITQQFIQLPDSTWTLAHDEVAIDFGFGDREKGFGLWGKKTTLMSDFVFDNPQKASVYAGDQIVIEAQNATEQTTNFWQTKRLEPLSTTEQHIYKKADKLMETADYQNFLGFKYLWATGYWKQGNVEFGSLGSIFSRNALEGKRLALGGRTTYDFSHHWRIEGYGAYGFKDKKWKYNAALTYQFNDERFNSRPQSALKLWYYNDVEVPGQNFENRSADNILTSIRRGVFDKMYYKRTLGIRYTNENESGVTYQVGFQTRQLTPAGSLSFQRENSIDSRLVTVANLRTHEAFINFRYAPNEEFFQGQTYRKRIVNKYPVFRLNYAYGNNRDALGGLSDYHNLSASVFKRFFAAPIGHTDIMLEGGRTFAKGVSYPSLHVFNANQTLSYEQFDYNQMNYLEFISDKYVSLNVEHAFDGFVLNKIPLIKKLKWREYVTFKAVYGGLDAVNNPTTNPSVFRFPTDKLGRSLTYDFAPNKPYMEMGFGIGNIFKMVRIDVTRRLNYLENPHTTKWRIQGQLLFDF